MTGAEAERRAATAAPDEVELLARLRGGDEQAFESLVSDYYPTMLAVARTYVRTRAVAEEVVQEAWVGRAEGARPLRGPLLPRDVENPHRREHRQDPRCARGAQRALLRARAGGRPSPVLEEWDALIEPSVREGPALLGFVAARIAEQLSGTEGYYRERACQTDWLVERLRLDAAR